ncbi:MAG: hypothetical protein ACK4NA_12735 [Alphaproteobacteria bacterium]
MADAPMNRPIAFTIGEEIFARQQRGLDAGAAYLRTLGYSEATLRDNLDEARAYANRLAIAADTDRLRQGVG